MSKAETEAAIDAVCEDLWKKYDSDNSGSLDKEEALKFVAEVCGASGGNDVDKTEFETFFNDLDKDGSGTLEKDEIKKFIKELVCGSDKWDNKISDVLFFVSQD